MANSIDPDEMACYNLSHLFAKVSVLVCRDEKVKSSNLYVYQQPLNNISVKKLSV